MQTTAKKLKKRRLFPKNPHIIFTHKCRLFVNNPHTISQHLPVGTNLKIKQHLPVGSIFSFQVQVSGIFFSLFFLFLDLFTVGQLQDPSKNKGNINSAHWKWPYVCGCALNTRALKYAQPRFFIIGLRNMLLIILLS